jgi:hypothetical protein
MEPFAAPPWFMARVARIIAPTDLSPAADPATERAVPALDPDRQREIEELFRATDHNVDALIDYSEFAQLVRDLDPGIEPTALRVGFSAIDTDRDGRIDLAEFLDWWAER